jgi:hypothetical protein
MFKFFSRNKENKRKRDEAIAAFAVADVPVEKLLERFHSDSALCSDSNQRRLLQEAVGVTEQHITLRNVTFNSRRVGAETCLQIRRLQDDSHDVRASQEAFRTQADIATATFAAHNAVVVGLRDHSVAEAEQKLESLSTMAAHVTTATEVLGHNIRAMSRQRQPRMQRRRSSSRCHPEEGPNGIQGTLAHYSSVVSGMEVQLQHLQATEGENAEVMRDYAHSLGAIEQLISSMEERIAALKAFQLSLGA